VTNEPTPTPELCITDVSLRLGGTQILAGLSLEVHVGEVVAILGASGSGKSTILRLLLGLLPPDRGAVSLRGIVASSAGRVHIPPEDRGLAIVFQNLALWPHLTVAGNLRFVLRSQKAPRDREADSIAEMLRRVALSKMGSRYPGELSGGERQRVAIARALVTRPSALLLDEPLAGLDRELEDEMLALLGELVAEREITTVLVTHDRAHADALGARSVRLERGALLVR